MRSLRWTWRAKGPRQTGGRRSAIHIWGIELRFDVRDICCGDREHPRRKGDSGGLSVRKDADRKIDARIGREHPLFAQPGSRYAQLNRCELFFEWGRSRTTGTDLPNSGSPRSAALDEVRRFPVMSPV